MSRSKALIIVLPLLWAVIGLGSQNQERSAPGDLHLRIVAKETTLRQDEQPQLTAIISNKGKTQFTLVMPGDGSESGWRTPVIGWSVIKVGKDVANHPQTPTLFQGGRCGNINSLKKGEVFVLSPGESKELKTWIDTPRLAEPGTYSLVFYYTNDPALKWIGLPLGQHDSAAMIEVQKSHKCVLVSNELKLVVKPNE